MYEPLAPPPDPEVFEFECKGGFFNKDDNLSVVYCTKKLVSCRLTFVVKGLSRKMPSYGLSVLYTRFVFTRRRWTFKSTSQGLISSLISALPYLPPIFHSSVCPTDPKAPLQV